MLPLGLLSVKPPLIVGTALTVGGGGLYMLKPDIFSVFTDGSRKIESGEEASIYVLTKLENKSFKWDDKGGFIDEELKAPNYKCLVNNAGVNIESRCELFKANNLTSEVKLDLNTADTTKNWFVNKGDLLASEYQVLKVDKMWGVSDIRDIRVQSKDGDGEVRLKSLGLLTDNRGDSLLDAKTGIVMGRSSVLGAYRLDKDKEVEYMCVMGELEAKACQLYGFKKYIKSNTFTKEILKDLSADLSVEDVSVDQYYLLDLKEQRFSYREYKNSKVKVYAMPKGTKAELNQASLLVELDYDQALFGNMEGNRSDLLLRATKNKSVFVKRKDLPIEPARGDTQSVNSQLNDYMCVLLGNSLSGKGAKINNIDTNCKLFALKKDVESSEGESEGQQIKGQINAANGESLNSDFFFKLVYDQNLIYNIDTEYYKTDASFTQPMVIHVMPKNAALANRLNKEVGDVNAVEEKKEVSVSKVSAPQVVGTVLNTEKIVDVQMVLKYDLQQDGLVGFSNMVLAKKWDPLNNHIQVDAKVASTYTCTFMDSNLGSTSCTVVKNNYSHTERAVNEAGEATTTTANDYYALSLDKPMEINKLRNNRFTISTKEKGEAANMSMKVNDVFFGNGEGAPLLFTGN